MNIQIHEAQRNPNRLNRESFTKTHYKEILKIPRQRENFECSKKIIESSTYKENPIIL